MRNVLIVCLYMTSVFIGYSQSECKTALIGGTVKAVVKDSVKSLAAETLYKKSMDWVAYTFRNTNAVSQSQVENKMVRITGISPKGISAKAPPLGIINYDLKYTIQIDIKDEKVRFTVYDILIKGIVAPYTEASVNGMYKKNGEMRTNKSALLSNQTMNNTLNELYIDFYNYLSGKSKSSNDDW